MKTFKDALQRLRHLLPGERLLIDPAHLAAYESDGLTAFAVTPRAVVIAETSQEIIETVRICHDTGIPFVARGSGTSLSGGSLPHSDGIIIALNRMDRILEIDPRQRIAVVQPGTINLAVSVAARPHGLQFAPDPSSGQVCTIGGNIAFNAGGAHCLKYGMTSNHVLGIKAVTAEGTVIELGNRSTESTGPDLTGIFCGSEGLFGIALEITLRLVPKPECFHTVFASYDSLQKAGDAVSQIIASRMLPGALEIMDKLAIEAAEAAVGAGYPRDSEAVLIVELEGTSAQVEHDRNRLSGLLDDSGADVIHVAGDDLERERIWKGRKSAFSAVGRLSPDFIVQDGVVPRRLLGKALRKIQEIARQHKVRVANVFHAGDGNLHPLIMYDGRVEGALEQGEACAAQIVKMCTDMGGSITGEHGVGMEKRAFLGNMYSEDDINLMHRVRRGFDPKEIANRGKMFPSGEAPSLSLYGLHPLEKKGIISRE
ncbi:MAG: FAD-binding protein [Verrucomicrobiales bacterium]|nr:FAD-binding protein [Verrucomicrobiales bacterium]